MEQFSQLLELSHSLGQEGRDLAILGEGNTSMRLDETTFAVKASGSNLGSLTPEGIAVCHFEQVLALFDKKIERDEEVDEALLAARVDPRSRKPSTEALFHAYLLTLPDVNFVGHTHPVTVNGILSSPRAQDFAQNRLCPDEIVCCGAASALVPYVNPGVPLARAIRDEVLAFRAASGQVPRVILLGNHGLIALGKTPQAVLATTLMAEKAARIFAGAVALGGPKFLTTEQVTYIAGWSAEHYRQKVLKL